MPKRRFAFSPKIDPPAIVPCPQCLESVLATRGKYWDSDSIGEGLFNYTEHRHQRQPMGYKEDAFNAHPGKEQPED